MNSFGRNTLPYALILLAVLVMAAPNITQGGLGWSDAPNHAFDGIFILEFMKEWPLGHARAWAEQFYLRHPALGIIVYYPPGFAAVEACLFAALGANIFAARLTVLLFAVGAGWMMYLLGRRWFDRPTGLFAALLLITCPHGFLWMNDVMLEWPATFWILACVYCYERDRETNLARWSVALAASIVMAFMTKQTAGFIFPVLIVHALLQRTDACGTGVSPVVPSGGRRYFSQPVRLACLLAAGVIISTYILLTRKYAALPAQLLTVSLSLRDMVHWPVEILGWPLAPIALLGLATFLCRTLRGPRGLLLLWFLCWTGFSLIIAAKEPRYFFFSLPPLMFGATRFMIGFDVSTFRRFPAVQGAERRISWRADRPRIVLLTVLVASQACLARVHDLGKLPAYRDAVLELVKRADADVVLVDAVRDGQFAFDLYQNEEARRRIIPLRTSKLLYARASRERYGYQQFVKDGKDIVALLDKYGIRYIVMESVLPATQYVEADPPPRKMLRDLLSTDSRFKLIRSWPLRCKDRAWNDVELRLYAYPDCPPRQSKTITFSMPSMGGDVTLTLP